MDAKAGLKGFAEGRRDILMIDPRKIEVEPDFNGRDFALAENMEHVAWLRSSIIDHGVKEPLTVRLKDGRVSLVGGECRLRAVLSAISECGADIKAVPCQIEERGTDEASRLAEMVVRNTGKRFNPMELARICKRLSAYGWEQGQIAKGLGISPSYVSTLFDMLAMPAEAHEMVRNGEVAPSTALNAIRAADSEAEGVAALQDAVASSKAAGKKKATTSRVARAAASRGGKKGLMTLNTVKTEKVGAFFHYVGRARSLEAVKEEADRVFREIFGRD